jgi:hypothetical protein
MVTLTFSKLTLRLVTKKANIARIEVTVRQTIRTSASRVKRK